MHSSNKRKLIVINLGTWNDSIYATYDFSTMAYFTDTLTRLGLNGYIVMPHHVRKPTAQTLRGR